MKKTVLKCLGIMCMMVAMQGSLNAAQENFDVGKTAAATLAMEMGARPVAMAGAFTGLADDYNATSYNPAGLAGLSTHQAGFMHNIYLQDTSIEYLGAAYKLSSSQSLGLAVTYLNYGEMDKFGIGSNGLPEDLGSFTPYDLVISGAYAQQVMNVLSVGATVKYYQQSIDTKSYTAVALDLGVLYKTGLEGLSAGLAVKNVGSQIEGSNLPIAATVGAGYKLPFTISASDKWVVDLDIDLPFGDVNYVAAKLGTEYWYNQMVALRAGYKMKDKGDLDDSTGLSFGAGVKYSIVQLDYALVSFGELGLTHQMALSMNF